MSSNRDRGRLPIEAFKDQYSAVCRFHKKARRGPRGPAGAAAPTNSLRPHNFASNTLTFPTHLYQQVGISNEYNSYYIIIKATNLTGSTLNFVNIPPSNTFQIWLNFYTENGDTLAKSDTSVAFYPEFIGAITTPAEQMVINGESIEYHIKIENFKFEMPTVAKYWSLAIRVQDYTFGSQNFSDKIPITSLYITPFNII